MNEWEGIDRVKLTGGVVRHWPARCSSRTAGWFVTGRQGVVAAPPAGSSLAGKAQ
ncbi:hypothetical protein [Chloroflexus islandicus]|uniref:hypothetical protein n=1 Tax=Chloroflexus islandicus TaxID=1707952 RepID=UPI000AB89DA2|nr:hypothetical protein [Chloroflexus islandicus]